MSQTKLPWIEEFGVTETFDPSLDFSWIPNLKLGNIIITKRLNDKLIQALLDNICRIILHLTCTGMGGSKLEPFVPDKYILKDKLIELIELGFPIKQVVLRISPIIPTKHGISLALDVINLFSDLGITRVRFSTINMYPHVKERFKALGLEIPYQSHSSPIILKKMLLQAFAGNYRLDVQDGLEEDVCGEIDFRKGLIEKISCVSNKDLEILGLQDKIILDGSGWQRPNCGCPVNKKQIMRLKPQRCGHKCVYCYEPD